MSDQAPPEGERAAEELAELIPLPQVVAALAGLRTDLEHAAEMYREGLQIDQGLIGIMAALKGTIQLVDDLTWAPALREPLLRLFSALEANSSGTSDPLLEPLRVGNRPRLTPYQLKQRGYIAGAMEALMHDGASEADAARLIIRLAPGIAQLFLRRDGTSSGKGELWHKVKYIRDEASQKDPKSDIAAMLLKTAKEFLAASSEPGKGRAYAERLLQDARLIGKSGKAPR